MAEITFSTGVLEMSVNGVRTIKFNPADIGFAEKLYGLVAKIDEIEKRGEAKRSNTDDMAKVFEYYRASDKQMRQIVDAEFGEGFCDDVFSGVRLTALSDGLTVIENFIFAVLDEMDDTITDNIAKRQGRIEKYTEKYKKHKGA